MQTACNNKQLILAPTPLLYPDGVGGTHLVLDNDDVCPTCGELAKCRKMFMWKGTKRDIVPEDIEMYGYGGVVEMVFKVCTSCDYAMNIRRKLNE